MRKTIQNARLADIGDGSQARGRAGAGQRNGEPSANLDDPAVVIGLAMRFARLGGSQGRIPDTLLARLRTLAANGVPAARLTLMMLIRRGKVPTLAAVPGDDHGRIDAVGVPGDDAGDDAAGHPDASEAT